MANFNSSINEVRLLIYLLLRCCSSKAVVSTQISELNLRGREFLRGDDKDVHRERAKGELLHLTLHFSIEKPQSHYGHQGEGVADCSSDWHDSNHHILHVLLISLAVAAARMARIPYANGLVVQLFVAQSIQRDYGHRQRPRTTSCRWFGRSA